MFEVKNDLLKFDTTRIKKMLHILVPIFLCIIRIKLYIVVLVVGEAHCEAAKGLLTTAFYTYHNAVRERLLDDSVNFEQEFDHGIEQNNIDHLFLVKLIIIAQVPFEVLCCLTEMRCFKVQSLRSLVEPAEEWPASDLRILLGPWLEVFLSDSSNFLADDFCIGFIAYPIAQRPPCLVHPQLPKVVVATHVGRLHLCYAVDNLENVANVEEIKEFAWRRLYASFKELIEIKCGFHAVSQRGTLNSRGPVVGVSLQDLSKE